MQVKTNCNLVDCDTMYTTTQCHSLEDTLHSLLHCKSLMKYCTMNWDIWQHRAPNANICKPEGNQKLKFCGLSQKIRKFTWDEQTDPWCLSMCATGCLTHLYWLQRLCGTGWNVNMITHDEERNVWCLKTTNFDELFWKFARGTDETPPPTQRLYLKWRGKFSGKIFQKHIFILHLPTLKVILIQAYFHVLLLLFFKCF